MRRLLASFLIAGVALVPYLETCAVSGHIREGEAPAEPSERYAPSGFVARREPRPHRIGDFLDSVSHVQAPAKDRLVASVDRGLAFLASQGKDGIWNGSGNSHPAVTSLAVLAFLSAGHVPGEGPYQANIDKAVQWILTQQQPSGLFSEAGGDEMYQLGICTMMLCEVMAMSDAKTAKKIKPKLEKAVERILQAQRMEPGLNRGGWRYQLVGNDADMSVSGWQILALRAAKNLGCDIPGQRIELAMKFVEQCREPMSGGFSYVPGVPPSQACTGTGILALELCGKERHHSREALQGGAYLLKHTLQLTDPYFHYAAYYTSQAMFQLGGNYWTIHRTHLHKALLSSQQQNGSWMGNDGIGPSYTTALAILALTVEYRLLPLYQRDETSEPRLRK